ncbi:MAG: DUF6600 domain-containing protein [Acidobacteriota bacterium]
MKKAALLSLVAVALALPLLGDDEPERHQSYLSYDDGGTIVRSGEDGSEIEATRSLPIYPGDEIITSRRGRAEVRLSDGNIIGIDRATSLRFVSVLDSYEGEDGETVATLKYGKLAIHRTDLGRDHVRLDTDNASYLADDEAVYSVETDARGRDRVMVFDGTLEVRTRQRTTRLRSGESATVDDGGLFDLVGDQRDAADDFEKWFLRRAERFGSYNSKHMDRRLAYWSEDLDDYGNWVYVSGVGYSWRPTVAVGWRPFYNGYWHSRNGCLTWVSYDPWGWGTYHYGRWAFDPGYGWVWVPGYGYSPAWVYWMYGSGYVGWAPAGWWDCYRSYYSWAYNPYRNHVATYGFGFNGRVRVSELDLRPWTFLDSRGIVSTRVDRAALTADAVKQRLGHARDGYATVSGGPSRFTREEWNDPADVIRRRGLGGVPTGAETGAPEDMTPFFRRDGDLGGAVRDRIARGRGGATGSGTPTRTAGGSSGSVAPIGGGGIAPIGRGSVAPIGGSRDGSTTAGRVNRGATPPSRTPPGDSSGGATTGRTGRGIDRGRSGDTPNGDDSSSRTSPIWRDRGRTGGSDRGRSGETAVVPPTAPATTPSAPERTRGESWRGRTRNDGPSTGSEPTSGDRSSAPTSSGSDVPRRVIDRINGPRVTREKDGDSGSRERSSSTRSKEGRDRSSGSSTRDSSRGSGSGSGSSAPRASSGNDSGRSSNSGNSGRSSSNSGSGRKRD